MACRCIVLILYSTSGRFLPFGRRGRGPDRICDAQLEMPDVVCWSQDHWSMVFVACVYIPLVIVAIPAGPGSRTSPSPRQPTPQDLAFIPPHHTTPHHTSTLHTTPLLEPHPDRVCSSNPLCRLCAVARRSLRPWRRRACFSPRPARDCPGVRRARRRSLRACHRIAVGKREPSRAAACASTLRDPARRPPRQCWRAGSTGGSRRTCSTAAPLWRRTGGSSPSTSASTRGGCASLPPVSSLPSCSEYAREAGGRWWCSSAEPSSACAPPSSPCPWCSPLPPSLPPSLTHSLRPSLPPSSPPPSSSHSSPPPPHRCRLPLFRPPRNRPNVTVSTIAAAVIVMMFLPPPPPYPGAVIYFAVNNTAVPLCRSRPASSSSSSTCRCAPSSSGSRTRSEASQGEEKIQL